MWISTSQRPSFLISAALRHLRAFFWGFFGSRICIAECVIVTPSSCERFSRHCASVCTCQSQPVAYTNLCCQRDAGVRLGPLSRQLGSSYTTLQTSQHQSYCAAPLFFFFFWGRLRSRQRCADNKEGSGPRNRNTHTHTHTHRCKCKFCVYTVTARINIVQLRSTLREWGLQREPKYRKWLRPNDLVWNSRHGGGG